MLTPFFTAVLIICPLVGNGQSCLTWNIQNDIFELSCYIENLDSRVSFLDPRGIVKASCITPTTASSCSSYVPNGAINQNVTSNTTVFLIDAKNTKEGLNGLWKCIHGPVMVDVSVDIIHGVISSVDVNLISTVQKLTKHYSIRMKCGSCWKPVGNTAEFQVDNVSEDEVRYFNGECYHRRRLCNPDICTCSADRHEYTWTYSIINLINKLQISCIMRFQDNIVRSEFSKKSTMQYNGTDFIQIRGLTVITAQDKSETEMKDRNNHETTEDGIKPLVKLAIIIVVTVLSIAIVVTGSICIHYKTRYEPVQSNN